MFHTNFICRSNEPSMFGIFKGDFGCSLYRELTVTMVEASFDYSNPWESKVRYLSFLDHSNGYVG